MMNRRMFITMAGAAGAALAIGIESIAEADPVYNLAKARWGGPTGLGITTLVLYAGGKVVEVFKVPPDWWQVQETPRGLQYKGKGNLTIHNWDKGSCVIDRLEGHGNMLGKTGKIVEWPLHQHAMCMEDGFDLELTGVEMKDSA